MADREVMAHLLEATSDDNSKVTEPTIRLISKAAAKSKEPAVRDMAIWLRDRLQKSDSPTVKIKTLRVITLMANNPKAARFKACMWEVGGDAVGAAAAFTCPPDPTHGDKPAEFVRANANKCLGAIAAGAVGPIASPATGGHTEVAVPEGVPPGGIRARVEARAKEALAKAEAAAAAAKEAATEAAAGFVEAAHEHGGGGTTSYLDGFRDPPEPEPQQAPGQEQPRLPGAQQQRQHEQQQRQQEQQQVAAVSRPMSDSSVDPAMVVQRQLELGRSADFTVEARGAVVFAVAVQPADFEVQWEFRLQAQDIGFCAKFEPVSGLGRELAQWAPAKYEAGAKSVGKYRVTEPGRLLLEWDNGYSRMRSKSLSLTVQSVGAEITITPCRWEMGEREWDPFLKQATSEPTLVDMEPFSVRARCGATWGELIELVQRHVTVGVIGSEESELLIVGVRSGSARVPLGFPGDQYLATVNYSPVKGNGARGGAAAGAGEAVAAERRRRIVSHCERGGFGLFASEPSRYLDSDPLPSDILANTAGVELQLPASDDAWAHHLAEAARYERLVHPHRPAVGEQSISVTNSKTMDDGKVYYELTWVDKRGRAHVVWKRYSRFDELRTTLGKGYMKGIKDIPGFPKKQKTKGKKLSASGVEQRGRLLQEWMQLAIEMVPPLPFEDDGKVMFEFLTEESEL